MSDAVIKVIADGAVVPVVAIGAFLVIFRVPRGDRLRVWGNIVVAGLLAYLFAKMASVLYQPIGGRPFEVLGIAPRASFLDNPGFPSDHALFVTAITAAVWYVTRSKIWTGILVALVAIVCIGRVFALVHTVEDVVFGVLCALVGALWYYNDRRVRKRDGKANSR